MHLVEVLSSRNTTFDKFTIFAHMDILTHGLTGIAISSSLLAHSKGNWKQKSGIASLGLLGGILPDIDVISKWSGFDRTFGNWFNLKESGNAIFGQTHWYSHHVFTHSILGALFFALLLITSYLLIKRFQNNSLTPHLKFYVLAFLLAYFAHLFQDMITPGGPWKGIAFFWPSSNFVGGWGKIWWWDNYDLFLIVCLVIGLNSVVLFSKFKTKILSKVIILMGLILFVFQTEKRTFDYNQKNYQKNAQQAKQDQKQFLGEKLYKLMEKLDNGIPVAF